MLILYPVWNIACHALVAMRSIILISAITTLGDSIVPYQCPEELATARAAFEAYKDSYAFFKVTASTASANYLSVTASENMIEWVRNADRFLSAMNYDSTPDHLIILTAMMLDVEGAQLALDEFRKILHAETDMPVHIWSQFATSLDECERQYSAISDAEYLCGERFTPRAPRSPISALEEMFGLPVVVLILLSVFIFNHISG